MRLEDQIEYHNREAANLKKQLEDVINSLKEHECHWKYSPGKKVIYCRALAYVLGEKYNWTETSGIGKYILDGHLIKNRYRQNQTVGYIGTKEDLLSVTYIWRDIWKKFILNSYNYSNSLSEFKEEIKDGKLDILEVFDCAQARETGVYTTISSVVNVPDLNINNIIVYINHLKH